VVPFERETLSRDNSVRMPRHFNMYSILAAARYLFLLVILLRTSSSRADESGPMAEIHAKRRTNQNMQMNGGSNGNIEKRGRNQSDPENCGQQSNVVGLTRPCRKAFMDNLMESAGPETMEAMFPGLFNTLTFPVFVGVPNNHRSISHSLTYLLAQIWGSAMRNMEFHLPKRMERMIPEEMQTMMSETIEDRQGRRKRGNNQDEDNGGVVDPSSSRDPFDGVRSLQRIQLLDFFHVGTLTEMMGTQERKTVWRYDISFAGYWREGAIPINDVEINDISAALTNYTNRSERFIRGMLRTMTNEPVSFGVSMDDFASIDDEDEGFANTTDTPPPTAAPSSDVGVVFANETDGETNMEETPLQVGWDAQRLYGLVLFCLTVCLASTLVAISARRKERRDRSMIWSNLTSEDGVKELLETGWKINNGKMEVFDKSQWGYSDNESIFQGGYHQTETPIGTQISVTQPVTESSRTELETPTEIS